MVNDTLLPPRDNPAETLNHMKNQRFLSWHGIR
jgi:hypothetical protein